MRNTLIQNILTVTTIIVGLTLGSGVAIARNQSSNEVSIVAQYYQDANQIVDRQLKDLFIFFNNIDIQDENYLTDIQTALTPPAPAPSTEACESNLTSTCLQYKLNNLYANLSSDLDQIAELPADNTATSLDAISSSNATRAKFINDHRNLTFLINQQAIEFYRQVLFAYPIHIQNQKIIDELKVLRRNLKDLENNLEPYNNSFHNVTSACK